jgi:hypothetical protein
MREALENAMVVAALAPSIFNTQPWSWDIGHDHVVLRADATKQLTAIDPQARMLTVSCGASLHHACVELAALGYEIEVSRPADLSGILAKVGIHALGRPDASAADLAWAAWYRRTDRRPFAPDSAVTPEETAFIIESALTISAAVEDITTQAAFLTTAAAAAESTERRDPAYRDVLDT